MSKTIDCTPTWQEVLRLLLHGYENGNATGRQIALEELQRMAELADCASIIMGAHRRPDAPDIPEAREIKNRLDAMAAPRPVSPAENIGSVQPDPEFASEKIWIVGGRSIDGTVWANVTDWRYPVSRLAADGWTVGSFKHASLMTWHDAKRIIAAQRAASDRANVDDKIGHLSIYRHSASDSKPVAFH